MLFNEEHEAFRDAIRKMVQKHAAPLVPELEATDRFPAELVPVFGNMGLLQLWLPEEYGGPGAPDRWSASRRKRLRRSRRASTLCANNSISFILPILNHGTEAQKQKYLPLSDVLFDGVWGKPAPCAQTPLAKNRLRHDFSHRPVAAAHPAIGLADRPLAGEPPAAIHPVVGMGKYLDFFGRWAAPLANHAHPAAGAVLCSALCFGCWARRWCWAPLTPCRAG